MLSLRELERAAAVLRGERRDARLERVVQEESGDVLLQLSGGAERPAADHCVLRLSPRPRFGRIGALPRMRRAPASPPALAQYLKAHVEGGRLRDAALERGDRLLRLRFETREGEFAVLLSLLGPRSNVYVLDRDERLVAAARPLSETRRDLALGGPWSDPPSDPPPAGEDRFAAVEDDQLLAAIEAHYAALEAEAGEGRLRERLAQALRKQRAALERKARAVERDQASAAEADAHEREGELLKAHLAEVPARATSVRLPDFETGEPVEIALDPALSPAKNADACFRRARKARRRGAAAAQEQATLAERLAVVAEAEAALAAAGDEAALRALAERPEVARLVARYFPPLAPAPGAGAPAAKPARVWRIGKRELPTRLVPKVYETADGLEIWVGKNDEGNDLLTTRLARGNDLFFHLEGSPGSHVILRVPGQGEAPQASLLDAAELAVHFSKARNAGNASVHVAAVKDISKPAGAKPGLVYVHRGRSFVLRREARRLERLLASRRDD